MPSQQQEKPATDQKTQDTHRLKADISKHVLLTLGQPRELHSVQVRQLWDDHYRVNVLIGPDVVNAKVAHSYFLVVDTAGKVVTSNPRITKKY